MDLISAISAVFPEKPEQAPFGNYVYSISVDGVIRYVGKGSGFRAWDHFPSIISVLKNTLEGRSVESELFFHKMFVRYLARTSERITVKVNIQFQGLTEAQAFHKEERLIRSLPLYQVNASQIDEGLWNVGGRGLNVHNRVAVAHDDHQNGKTKFRSLGRNRPGKRGREDSKFMFGEFGSGKVN